MFITRNSRGHTLAGKGEQALFVGNDQCDQIGRFVGLWATF